jgi:hypothetical protein
MLEIEMIMFICWIITILLVLSGRASFCIIGMILLGLLAFDLYNTTVLFNNDLFLTFSVAIGFGIGFPNAIICMTEESW